MANNWYSNDNWYAPLQSVPSMSAPTPKENKKKRSVRIIAIVCVLAILLVATSLIFAERGQSIAADPSTDGDMPENWQDFFDQYYTKTTTDVAEINIPRAKLPIDYELTLTEKSGGSELTLGELYENSYKSVVGISAYTDGQSGYSWGTGFVLTSDGLIVTNTHVINGADSATVTLYDDTVLNATLVGADTISDIAVLKVKGIGLNPVTVGDSAELAVGDAVAAIGNPLGEEFRMTLTNGVISAINRGVNYNGRSMTLMQTNAALNEGNSGGPLFNMYGQVIGVTNMKMMSSYSSIEGIGFAIPSTTMRDIVNALVRDGEVRGRPSIGITVGAIPENASSHYDIPSGLYISAVTPGSDAEAKGIKVGDILLECNGTEVKTTEDVAAVKSELQVGDTIHFKLWRDGDTFEVDVMLMDTNDIYS